jgi:hypothetical protein
MLISQHACLSVGKRVALLERIQTVDAIAWRCGHGVTLALLAAARQARCKGDIDPQPAKC